MLAVSLAVLVIFSSRQARGDEKPAKSRIVAVDLFKNGLAVVKREVTINGPGTYVLDNVPQPVHGTYSVESAVPVETIVKMREVEVPVEQAAPGNLQEELAGKKVVIHFKGDKVPPTTGTMMKLKPLKPDEVRSAYEVGIQPNRYLVLQTGKGRAYLEASEIAFVEAEGADDKVKRRQPRLLLTVGEMDKAPAKIAISYLTKGITWAPSYRLDITDPKTLKLEQNAVVKNELADLNNTEVKLISGYPSVQFAHVSSLLSPRLSLATFFQELSQRGDRYADVMSNSVVMQQIAGNRSLPYGLGIGATPIGEGVDLHYQSIGKRTLAEGEVLDLSVARAKTDYERIVEWLVPDTRNEYGQHVDRRGQEPEEESGDSAWDALKFKNPFTFAMTTGPATVVADGKFNGQRTSYWVNSGEETVLRVTKALSVRTRATEHEELKNGDSREIVWIGGRQFRRSTVEGELELGNHRQETIRVMLRRGFSGELISADGEPKKSLREEGICSVNTRNELLWSFSLKAGEVKKLGYRYTVLVAF
jgi:hypothetical protein